jgi:hypothetical protein
VLGCCFGCGAKPADTKIELKDSVFGRKIDEECCSAQLSLHFLVIHPALHPSLAH